MIKLTFKSTEDFLIPILFVIDAEISHDFVGKE